MYWYYLTLFGCIKALSEKHLTNSSLPRHLLLQAKRMLSSITQFFSGSKMDTFISDLRPQLSEGSRILTPSDADFSAANERWTDIDRKTPAVIVQPACEDDIVVLVGQPRTVAFTSE